jgi:ribosomal protein L12E/L44/L45/RPP1/RPP2
MRARQTTATADGGARVTRFAWLVSFLATLTLVAILALAKSAQALTVADPGSPVTAAPSAPPSDLESEEDEEEEFEAEECEEDEEEECEGEASGAEVPDECLLSSAQATVFASGAQDKLRLVVRYTTSTPTLVAVDYGLHGSKGSLYLGQSKEQFGKSGVFRQTEILSEAQMAKATGARDFTVQLYAVHAPASCRHYFERHLTARHAAPSGLTWVDPDDAALRR